MESDRDKIMTPLIKTPCIFYKGLIKGCSHFFSLFTREPWEIFFQDTHIFSSRIRSPRENSLLTLGRQSHPESVMTSKPYGKLYVKVSKKTRDFIDWFFSLLISS